VGVGEHEIFRRRWGATEQGGQAIVVVVEVKIVPGPDIIFVVLAAPNLDRWRGGDVEISKSPRGSMTFDNCNERMTPSESVDAVGGGLLPLASGT